MQVWAALETHRIPDPPKLARVSPNEIQALDASATIADLIALFWRAIRIERANSGGIAAPVIAFRQDLS